MFSFPVLFCSSVFQFTNVNFVSRYFGLLWLLFHVFHVLFVYINPASFPCQIVFFFAPMWKLSGVCYLLWKVVLYLDSDSACSLPGLFPWQSDCLLWKITLWLLFNIAFSLSVICLTAAYYWVRPYCDCFMHLDWVLTHQHCQKYSDMWSHQMLITILETWNLSQNNDRVCHQPSTSIKY